MTYYSCNFYLTYVTHETKSLVHTFFFRWRFFSTQISARDYVAIAPTTLRSRRQAPCTSEAASDWCLAY